MLYPIWQPLPRPRFFPEELELERLLDSNYDPAAGNFKMRMNVVTPATFGKGCLGRGGSETCRTGTLAA